MAWCWKIQRDCLNIVNPPMDRIVKDSARFRRCDERRGEVGQEQIVEVLEPLLAHGNCSQFDCRVSDRSKEREVGDAREMLLMVEKDTSALN